MAISATDPTISQACMNFVRASQLCILHAGFACENQTLTLAGKTYYVALKPNGDYQVSILAKRSMGTFFVNAPQVAALLNHHLDQYLQQQ